MAALISLLAVAIYPEGHWDHNTKLTSSNFEPFVKENVDAGKTVFAPAWNTITRAFSNNSKVAFGDVNLADDDVRGKYAGSPGDGGWPTIRFYNKQSGYEGGFAGDWKDAKGLSGAMCDVFGDEETMQTYVEDMGGVLGGIMCDLNCLCAKKPGGECSKQELQYYAKFEAAPHAEVESRLKLLSASAAKSANPDGWMSQRIALLKVVSKARAVAAAAEEKQEL